MLVAAIDVGTNSTRLLVAEVSREGILRPVLTDLATTRLGQGIQGGRLLQVAMDRTLAAIVDFVVRAERAGAGKIVLAATSAVRDAANRDQFINAVRSATGRELMVLPGPEEARLSYLGVTSALGDVGGALVIDIGGGSTEFIWRRAGKTRLASINAGAVRMTEVGYDGGQINNAIGDIMQDVLLDNPGEVIGVGGTVTTLAAMAQGMRRYDPRKIHGFRLATARVDELYRLLSSLTIEERRQLPGLQPQRADIIPAGARILSTILHGLARESILVSEADILHGLIMDIAGTGGKLSQ
ncbi:Ppx/GppA phosphatase family protein [Desulfallas thermosapovorans]|uniref:Exopolyphosphatase/guanosine-5'-triphosphate, 3'-diphosphate pyrophosphatase n=1 Tax=Desulfallas thermosapovorans DSM 6562 TaxID=1121431 RepID=A0A5S4ZVK8_9FIRM|nr:Ppx/GppA phosphatase family protein [Desulfallas thermosapovorans]TYO96952.1 exopolyphosphatase/guanosine-5'-triphosphate,3'-diphosphate pyrophosphatase [Desulfallas thermosapovorans DSM 6562]